MSWFRRRRLFDIFNDIMREFEEELRMIEEEIEELIRRSGERERRVVEGPYIYGVRITIGPEGIPKIEEFGNIKRGSRGRPFISEEIEPLVDVIEHEDEVWVVVDLPGVSKDKINVRIVDNKKLVIKASNGKKYSKEIELPAKVKPETAKASYKNGVLEIKIQKAETSKDRGYEVKID